MASGGKTTSFLGTAVARYDIDEADSLGKSTRNQQKVEVRRPDGTIAKSRGERTFYGAFTGGFSAGYWGTVGSKEGFTPASFSSSRSKRAGNAAMQAEDFMDEEDLREHKASHTSIKPREDFFARQGKAEQEGSATMPEGVVSELKQHVFGVKPESRLGTRLLAAPGTSFEDRVLAPTASEQQRQAAGGASSSKPGRKTYGCARPPTAAAASQEEGIIKKSSSVLSQSSGENAYRWPFEADLQRLWLGKTDLHGIDYGKPEGGGFRSVMRGEEESRSRLYLSDKRYQKARDFDGYGSFGTGVFDMEDYDVWEDVYNKGRIALSREEVPLPLTNDADSSMPPERPRAPQQSRRPRDAGLPGFVLGEKQEEGTTENLTAWEIPNVPRGFRGVHLAANTWQEEAEGGSAEHQQLLQFLKEHGQDRLMAPTSRAALLGETARPEKPAPPKGATPPIMTPPTTPPPTMVPPTTPPPAGAPLWQGVTDQQKMQLLQSLGRQFVVGSNQDMDGQRGQNEPFKCDPPKQRRYDAFCASMATSSGEAAPWNLNISEAERQEFARVYRMFRLETPVVESSAGGLASGKLPSHLAPAAEAPKKALKRRTTQEWQPEELLCKRWGVKAICRVAVEQKAPQKETFKLPAPEVPAPETSAKGTGAGQSSGAGQGTGAASSTGASGFDEGGLPKQPPRSLFTAIFGDDAEDD